ncbi:MAG: flagellar motor switch protein FliN [Pseudomonadota bacterium]
MADDDESKATDQDWGAAFEEVRQAQAEDKGGADLDWDAAFAEVAAAEEQVNKKASGSPLASIASEPAFFDDLKDARPGKAADRGLDFLLDIPLEISVELGRTRMAIGDLLKMGQGAIVELNRLAGEPVDVFVNGKLLGRGEVVVADEKFGVRLTEIVSAPDRIKSLA